MTEELELATQYRTHAKSLRAASEFDRDEEHRRVLKRIAGSYEQMALTLEHVDKTNKQSKRVKRQGTDDTQECA